MAKDDKKDGILSFIGSDVEIEGAISFVNSIRIDGTVNGDIISETGTLVVGRTADIKGNIRVGAATIMGVVNGNISARERVDAFPPAEIKGDIAAPIIGLENGVTFSGNCKIIPKSSFK